MVDPSKFKKGTVARELAEYEAKKEKYSVLIKEEKKEEKSEKD